MTPRKVNFLFFFLYRKKSFPFSNKLSLRTKSYPQRERKKKIINKVYLLIRLPVLDGQVYSSSPLLFAFIKFFSFSTVVILEHFCADFVFSRVRDWRGPPWKKNRLRLCNLRHLFLWKMLIWELRSDCYLRCSSRQEPVGYREVITSRKFKRNRSNGPWKCGTHAGSFI